MHGGHADAPSSASQKHTKPLTVALALTFALTIAEAIAGILTGSLALIADAAHMLTDAGGLALALFAIRFASRPATPEKTYGYLRAEILAALINAVVLLLIAGYVLYEAYWRILSPPEILGGPMLAVAVIGLVVNFISMKLLAAGSSESLNVKGAYFEVLSDMLGSLGVILAALIVMLTGWTPADPIIAAGIGLFIVPRTWLLLRQATNILLEGTPAHIDAEKIKERLSAIDGVIDVRDFHIWTITSGFDSLTAHLVVKNYGDARRIFREARTILSDEFDLDHVTIQIEDEELRDSAKGLQI
jgi:cobalt-zinc-cadmium efflux system protein